jgi:beta-phosphoglucomutase-like phosphatase (HAD superfamily)
MKPFIEAVIFDFNGTLFFDTDFHNQAWKIFAAKYNKHLTLEDFQINIHGRTNKEILYYLFNEELSKNLLNQYYEEKEEIYRIICFQNPEMCILAPGAEDFLNFLHENHIKKTIATASYIGNINFYINLFHLERWFKKDDIIYDTGEYRGKPSPDLFLAASRKLHVIPENCMIIEDSTRGLQAAKNSNAGKIIAISNSDSSEFLSKLDFIDQIITDFRQIDKQTFFPDLNLI